MISIYDKLIYLYPDAQEDDWKLQDDGQGAYIKEWNRQEMQPTQQELNNVIDEEAQQVKDARKELQINNKIKAKLQAMDGIDKLILKGMFKDLKARNIVNTVDEFISYLRD